MREPDFLRQDGGEQQGPPAGKSPGAKVPIPDGTAGPSAGITGRDAPVLFSTGPEKMRFVYRYLASFTPAILVILCIFVRDILNNLLHAASGMVPSLIPAPIATAPGIDSAAMTQYLGTLNTYTAGVGDAAMITIFLVAPVGIFIFAAGIGWALRVSEVWTGVAATLLLSAGTALVLTGGPGNASFSGDYFMLFLQWIAFLVQPFSVLASLAVLAGTEKFRQSVWYMITPDAVVIRGGIFSIREQTLPHHLLGRVVLEQDFFGSRYNYGTVIPQSLTRWGAETSFRGIGAAGQKDNFGVGIGYAKGREEASRHPLDCLYGIRDPRTAQRILEGMMTKTALREEQQTAYLRTMCEMQAATVPGEPPRSAPAPVVPAKPPAAVPLPVQQPPVTAPVPGIVEISPPQGPVTVPVLSDEELFASQPATVRLGEEDLPDRYACSVCGKKELPPYYDSNGTCYCSEHFPGHNKKTGP